MKYLGKTVTGPITELEKIDWEHGQIEIQFECTEFTSFCPVTGMPDFAQLSIVYVPDKHIVETKSLKLFLQSYRDVKSFNEAIVADIADKFFEQVRPLAVTVAGKFNLRGGIGVSARATRQFESVIRR